MTARRIEVERRIIRGAGSTYRINGCEARARDVQLLFADAASGPHSGALVGQGRIGALIAADRVREAERLADAETALTSLAEERGAIERTDAAASRR